MASLVFCVIGCPKSDAQSSAGSSSSSGTAAATGSGTGGTGPTAAAPNAGAANANVYAGGGPPPACTVASPADISAALGEAFTPGPQRPSAFSTTSVCNYTPTGGKTLIIRTEVIDKAGWEASVKLAKGAHPVQGVGDEAYFQPNQMMGVNVGQFLAYKGKLFVSINFGGMGLDMAKAEAAEKTLMTKILAKL